MYEQLKEIIFWLGFVITIIMLIKFFNMSRFITKDSLRMLKQATTMWHTYMANVRDHENPVVTDTQIEARKIVADNARAHPILGQFLKGAKDKHVFGLLTDVELLRGIGITATTGLNFLQKLLEFLGVRGQIEGEQRAPRQRSKKGQYTVAE